jgi:hypothetical protein
VATTADVEPAAADAGAAEPEVAEQPDVAQADAAAAVELGARECRELAGRYVDFNIAGDVSISTAIAELEGAQSDCIRALHARPDATTFDILQANLTGDQLRIVLSNLRAVRAEATGEDPCNDAIIGSTEAARSIRRIADAEQLVRRDDDPTAGEGLYEWEFRSLAPRRQLAWDMHRTFREEYRQCMIDPLPDDLRDPSEPAPMAGNEGSGAKVDAGEPIDPVYVPITP